MAIFVYWKKQPPPTPSQKTVPWGPGELFSELLTIPPLYSNIFWFDTIHGRMIFLPSSQKQKGTPCLTSWSLGPVFHKTATWWEAPQRRRPKDWNDLVRWAVRKVLCGISCLKQRPLGAYLTARWPPAVLCASLFVWPSCCCWISCRFPPAAKRLAISRRFGTRFIIMAKVSLTICRQAI